MNVPILNVNSSLHQGLQALEESSEGIYFVVDQHEILVGVVTDGDIRRFLLQGGSLDVTTDSIMVTNFFSLPFGASINEVQDAVSKFEIVPILDVEGMIADWASKKRFHHVPLIEPILAGNELEYVTDCIQTGWISSQGTYVRKFEQMFSEYVSSKSAVSVSNGTVAIHLALETLGIGPGDEVLVPDFTFASSVNAILHAGATPILVDIESDTLGMSVDSAEKLITPATKAIIIVHIYGQPAKLNELIKFSKKHNLIIIEDCAEALGSFYEGAHVGTFGDAATFSFFGNKTLTTGEGGMVIFSSKDHDSQARILRDHGMSPTKKYWHDVVGYNYRLTNLQAALGVAQLERAVEIVSKKRDIASEYNELLSHVEDLVLPRDAVSSQNSYWLYTVQLKPGNEWKRDSILRLLSIKGIEARPFFTPMHKMPPYADFGNELNFPVSAHVGSAGICLPSSPSLSGEQIKHVSNTLISALKSLGGS